MLRIPLGTAATGSRANERIVNHVTRTMPLTHTPFPSLADYSFLLQISNVSIL